MRSDLAGKEAGLTSDKSSLRYTHRRSNLQSINQSITQSVSQSVSQSTDLFIETAAVYMAMSHYKRSKRLPPEKKQRS